MKLTCTGTGYISSNITQSKINKNNGESIISCYFQFANLKYTDKLGNRKYSKYLCIAIGQVAKLIIDNFVKGQKVLIVGELEQKSIKNNIEFMANPKNDKFEKEETTKDNLEEIIENVDTSNINNTINDDTFT